MHNSLILMEFVLAGYTHLENFLGEIIILNDKNNIEVEKCLENLFVGFCICN